MKQRGFTLVELMIVVAVIGVLAAIAYPSYQEYIRRSHRTDATAALTAAAQAMEKFYTENMKYDTAALGTSSGNIATTTSSAGFYTIAFDSAPTGATACSGTTTTSPTATAFRLCATPTGVQANDSCGTFSLSNTGVRTPTTARCWN